MPDYQERFLVGAKGAEEYKRGEMGGQKTVALSVEQMPRHHHEVEDPGHEHGYTKPFKSKHKDRDDAHDRHGTSRDGNAKTGSASTGLTVKHTGSSHAHENRPPFVALNYIIKY